METIKINAEIRNSFGTSSAKKVRFKDMIPCVMYGGNEVLTFTVKPLDIRGLVYTPKFKVVELNIDGTTTKAILKDIQFHPVSDKVIHLDFQELVADKKVKTAVPVSFTGQAPGVKDGGTMVSLLRKISIKASPDSLVGSISGDVSGLEMGNSLAVKDLVIPEGIEVLENMSTPVLYIETPRSLKSIEGAVEEEEGEEGEEGSTEEAPKEEG